MLPHPARMCKHMRWGLMQRFPKKGNEISFLENEISKIKTNENYDFNDLYNDYEKIKINTENNEIIFSSKRGLLFLSAYLEKNLSGLDYGLWKRCLEDVSRYIPEGIFEDKEYEILKLEFFSYRLLDKKMIFYILIV